MNNPFYEPRWKQTLLGSSKQDFPWLKKTLFESICDRYPAKVFEYPSNLETSSRSDYEKGELERIREELGHQGPENTGRLLVSRPEAKWHEENEPIPFGPSPLVEIGKWVSIMETIRQFRGGVK